LKIHHYYNVLNKNSYDQFYNEHIYLFSALSVRNLLSKFGLEIFDIKNLKTHGGSLRFYIKRKKNKKIKISINIKKQINRELKAGLDNFLTYKNFSNRVTKSKQKILKILNNIKKRNKKVLGYGATAKAVTVLNYCDIGSDLIQNFTDTTPEKINRYMPGKNIKILQYKKDLLKNFDYVFLGAWNFKKEIINKESKFIKNGLKFITHIPTPKILKL
jgi:methylation protein EvaC